MSRENSAASESRHRIGQRRLVPESKREREEREGRSGKKGAGRREGGEGREKGREKETEKETQFDSPSEHYTENI